MPEVAIPDVAAYHGRLRAATGNFVFAPVRHHSPACAAHVRQLIRTLEPRHVLIEAPIDFEPLIPLILDGETVPPVAIATFLDNPDGLQSTTYYPFCAHSPEYVALLAAKEVGAKTGFIDLPSSHRLMLMRKPADNADDADEPSERVVPDGPSSMLDERQLDVSTYTKALAARLGCRDGLEVWDHLFETRLGVGEPQAFFADVGAYCFAIRRATPDTEVARQDAVRERHMIRCLEQRRRVRGPVVVLTGGFHTPALMAAVAARFKDREEHEDPADPPAARAYLIRYGFQQLDRLNGYGAGLPLPAYYDRVWRAFEAAPVPGEVWQSSAIDLFVEFATHMRDREPDRALSLPLLQSAIRGAIDLAALRGRRGPQRVDIQDAALSCFVKGEAVASVEIETLTEFLVGDCIGDVPASAGSPPLVEHARRRAQDLKFDLSSGARKSVELDIHRRPGHLEVSRFLHLMTLLGSDFARKEAGPDFIGGAPSDLLFERWSCAWSPQVEAALIELSGFGDAPERVGTALIHKQVAERAQSGAARDAGSAVQLFLVAMQAGLHSEAPVLLRTIDTEIADDPEFASVCDALRRLDLVWRARTVLGLVGSDIVEDVIERAYARALYLLPDIANSTEDHISPRLQALITLNEVVRSFRDADTGRFDPHLFDEALLRLEGERLPPVLAGGLAALLVMSQHRTADSLITAINGGLRGAYIQPDEKVGALYGVLKVAPELIRRVPGLIEAMDEVVLDVDEDGFVALLPHLRLAFSTLNPAEVDAVAEQLAELYGTTQGQLTAPMLAAVSDEETAANLLLDKQLRETLTQDGLAAWITGENEVSQDAFASTVPTKAEG